MKGEKELTMRFSLRRLFAVAGISAILGTVSHAGVRDTSPSSQVVNRTSSAVIAPTATSDCQTCSAISACDNSYSCCDNGNCGCKKRGLFSQFLGNQCDSGCCDSNTCCDSGCGLFSNLRGCDSGCDSGCGCGGLLGFGIAKHSEQCFNDFCQPLTNPVFFEDPRTLTQVRFLFINHEIPQALGGNSVQVYVAQVRVALSQKLSLIATKDGFVYTKSGLLDSGYADIAAGLKYNLYRDPSAGRILSVGAVMEAPTGSKKSLQGNGGGEWNFFTSAGTRILGSTRAHWVTTGGLRQPNNENQENRVMYWSNHFDYRLNTVKPLFVFTEIHWWNYLKDGNAFGAPVQGGDLFNLGSVGVTGDNLVTQAIGTRYVPTQNVSLGGAFEFPTSNLHGLMANRWTFDLIFQY